MLYPTILLPVFVQVALVFAIMVVLGVRRGRAMKRGEVDQRDAALNQAAWPDYARQPANSLVNQFQIPVLFYVVVILAMFTRKADILFVVLEWIFVLSRIVHAWIHVTSNHVPYRAAAFSIGALVVLVMWVLFAVRILLGA